MSLTDTELTRASLVAAMRSAPPRRVAEQGDLRRAAVAVCVIGSAMPCLLITRRSRSLRTHAGQWALPGGRLDEGEDAVAAALRELTEETGVVAGPDDVVGVLDDYVTRSGFAITPVVLWACDGGVALVPGLGEVVSLHLVSVAELDVEPVFQQIPESPRPVIQLPFLGRKLHAPTAAVIHQFTSLWLHGRYVDVSEFEQPLFAWH